MNEYIKQQINADVIIQELETENCKLREIIEQYNQAALKQYSNLKYCNCGLTDLQEVFRRAKELTDEN